MAAAGCGNGAPCTFLSRDLGWVPYDAKNTHLASGGAAYPPVSESWKDPKTTLLISIASFRDVLCPKTLFNLFTKAQYPGRITVSVIQQNIHGTDVDCLDTYCDMMKEAAEKEGKAWTTCPYQEQVLMTRINSKDARGPQWARAQASKVILNRKEGQDEFCMQMDSHMDFVHGFDTKMMEMWSETDNEYGVLSTYVTASESLPLFEGPNAKGVNGLHEVPHLCMITLQGQHGMPRNWGTKCARSLPHPKLTNAVWGAGLSFSKCHAERKVPYDPHLPFIFDGEEFSRGVRFWTHGYDVYTPHRVYVVHDYTNSQKDPLHFAWSRNKARGVGGKGGDGSGGGDGEMLHAYDPVDNDDTRTVVDSVQRIKWLLGRGSTPITGEPAGEEEAEGMRHVQRSKYGLGDRRSLEQAQAFTGVNLKQWHNDNMGNNRCGNLEYVPFTEHPKGAAYEPRYDPLTEEFVDERDPGSIYYSSSEGGRGGAGVGGEKTKATSAAPPATGGGSDGGSGGQARLQGAIGLSAGLRSTTADERQQNNSEMKTGGGIAATAAALSSFSLSFLPRWPTLPNLPNLSSAGGHPHAGRIHFIQAICVLVIAVLVAAGYHSYTRRSKRRSKNL